MSFESVMEKVRPISSETALHDEEAWLLYESICGLQSGSIAVEVGAQLGRSSVLIAQVAHDRGFHSIHIDPHCEQEEIASKWILSMKSCLPRDHRFSALFMRTDQAEWILGRIGVIDFAYIDGDHEYPGVMMDLRILCPLLRVGGILCVHDYGRDSLPGVYRAATEYLKNDEWDQIGVAKTMGAWRKR